MSLFYRFFLSCHFQANISESEYTKMLHIYQKSLRHTEILEELQEELAELEEEEEDRSAADAASPSTTSSTHHFFTAQSKCFKRVDLMSQ